MEGQEEGKNLKKEVEAILFAAGRKVGLEEISGLLKEKDTKKIKESLAELKREYDESDSPMFVIEEGDGWKMTVKERYLGVVKDVAPHTELNKALLETLAIVAWKQPVLQADVIRIRGSSAYEHIKDLVEMGFITKIKHGRSYVLKPSTRFFDYFDLPSKEAAKEVFKDVEFTDLQKRKDMGEKKGEEQQQIEEGGKAGKLEVYEKPGDKEKEEGIEKAENVMETEKLGELDVFEEPGEKEKAEETAEEAEEEQPETEEEKTKEIVEELMHEKKKEENYEGGEEAEEEQPETEEEAEESEEKPEKERRLSKELEDFAGIGKEKKKEESPKDGDSEEESSEEGKAEE